MPETVVDVTEVKAFETKSGNVRYVPRDADGNEYTTFREEIARAAVVAEGKRARITDEVGWRTAIEAAPYLLPGDTVEREIPADELFAKLQPFKELVTEDIEEPD